MKIQSIRDFLRERGIDGSTPHPLMDAFRRMRTSHRPLASDVTDDDCIIFTEEYKIFWDSLKTNLDNPTDEQKNIYAILVEFAKSYLLSELYFEEIECSNLLMPGLEGYSTVWASERLSEHLLEEFVFLPTASGKEFAVVLEDFAGTFQNSEKIVHPYVPAEFLRAEDFGRIYARFDFNIQTLIRDQLITQVTLRDIVGEDKIITLLAEVQSYFDTYGEGNINDGLQIELAEFLKGFTAFVNRTFGPDFTVILALLNLREAEKIVEILKCLNDISDYFENKAQKAPDFTRCMGTFFRDIQSFFLQIQQASDYLSQCTYEEIPIYGFFQLPHAIPNIFVNEAEGEEPELGPVF